MENSNIIIQQSKSYDSFYLYDEQNIIKNANRLSKDFNGVEFFYSIKANSAAAVAKCIFEQGFGADAASLREVKLAQKLGVPANKIQYSAPGKSTRDIDEALNISTIVADSIDEISCIQEIARKKNIVAEIGIRINPNFTFSTDKGISSKFGIDEEQVFELMHKWSHLPNIKIVGIHVHSQSQVLDYEVLGRYYKKMFNLVSVFQTAIGYKLKFVNMGSGLGIPYSSEDKPLNTAALGEVICNLIDKYKDKVSGVRIILETGRYVLWEGGVYVTKVLDKKVSMGKTYVVLCNTLNGFIRPSLAQLIVSYTDNKNLIGTEPLFTSRDAFQFEMLANEAEYEKVTLVGNLCTAADIVAKDIVLPKLKPGDIVVIKNAGSYAAALSPFQFSSLTPPAQLFLSCDGIVTNIAEYTV